MKKEKQKKKVKANMWPSLSPTRGLFRSQLLDPFKYV